MATMWNYSQISPQAAYFVHSYCMVVSLAVVFANKFFCVYSASFWSFFYFHRIQQEDFKPEQIRNSLNVVLK